MSNQSFDDHSLSTENPVSLNDLSPLIKNVTLEEKKIGAEPGNQLQRAREERHWSRADIATSLCLNVGVIIALEENDYSRLPFPTFVRGYLRNYARLLELEPEPLLAAYERHGGNTSPSLPITPPRRRQSYDYLWHFFSYIVIFGLIVLVAMWWRSDVPPDLVVIPEETVKPNVSSQESSFQELPSRELAEILAAGPPPEDNSSTTTRAPAQVEPSTIPASSTTSGPPPVATDVHTSSPTTPIQESSTTAGATTPTVEEKPTIIVEVSADTWVKIQDSKGKRLFNNLIKAGNTHSIQGKPPFKVRLGRVNGVTINYNGQPFDFSSYIKGKTANFVVGKP